MSTSDELDRLRTKAVARLARELDVPIELIDGPSSWYWAAQRDAIRDEIEAVLATMRWR